MRRVPESVQTQTPSDRAQAVAQRRKTVPVLQVHETVLALGLVQPTHEPPVLVLQTVQRVDRSRVEAMTATRSCRVKRNVHKTTTRAEPCSAFTITPNIIITLL